MRPTDELRERAKRAAQRAEEMRRRHRTVDGVFVLADRDSDVGGGIMAGSLAYRIFIWMLPFALVVVGGIGLAAAASVESPEDATRALGLHGIVSNSVAEAARSSSRWYALLIGIPVLVWTTRGLLRALIVVHRLVWGDPRRGVPKATFGASLQLLGMLVVFFAIRELARDVGSWSGSVVVEALFGLAAVSGWWLLLSVRLPHRGAPWRDLVPGAILVGVGFEVISIVGIYVITPRIESSQSAYGALGLAATLLFGLYIVSRLIVASAVLNATVREQRRARGPESG
jgi:membrane protein